jgi:hypothetical protein
LYWEEGYFWQEETIESKNLASCCCFLYFCIYSICFADESHLLQQKGRWCATFDYTGEPGPGHCWYGDQSLGCNSDQLYISKCSFERNQWFTFEPTPSGEVLIKLGNDKNQCWERLRRSIYIRTCDPNNPLQRWFALNGSLDDGDRFELSQQGFTNQCMTNAHHPKAGEVVEMHSCRASRAPDSETSFWVKY